MTESTQQACGCVSDDDMMLHNQTSGDASYTVHFECTVQIQPESISVLVSKSSSSGYAVLAITCRTMVSSSWKRKKRLREKGGGDMLR